MRILLIGDIVGKPGRRIVTQTVAPLREQQRLDLVIANAENAADGSGITPTIYRELIDAGVDCITMGDHIYRRKEINVVLESEKNTEEPLSPPHCFPQIGYSSFYTKPCAIIELATLRNPPMLAPLT